MSATQPKRMCIVCHKRPPAVPDRNVMGRPIKRVCLECHGERLRGDLALGMSRILKEREESNKPMTATKRRIALDIVATDAHCGARMERCRHADATWPKCVAFEDSELELDLSEMQFKRLPECIQAERRAQEGV